MQRSINGYGTLDTMSDQKQSGAGSLFDMDESQAQEDLMNLLSITPAAIVIVDTNQRIRLANAEAETTLCIRSADTGRNIHDVIAGWRSREIESCLREVLTDGRSHEIETEDSLGRCQLVRMKPYRTSRSHAQGAVIAFQDIQDLRTAQTNTMHARTLTKSMVGTVPTPLVVLHEDLRIKMVNEAFHQHFGTLEAELDNQLFFEIQQNRFDLDEVRQALTRVLKEHSASESLEIEQHIRGGRKHVSVTVRLVRPATETMLLIALNDITARKEAEILLLQEHKRLRRKIEEDGAELERTREEAQMALQESRIELLRSREELRHLTASLLHAQDEERRRVSRELHDDLSQRVAKLQFEVELLEQKVPFADLEDAREKLRSVRDEVGLLAEDLRRVAHQLHPSVLDHLGLVVALRSYITEFTRSTQIHVELQAADIPRELPPELANCAYRITQEALRNVAKHARTNCAEVVLQAEPGLITLLIRDEGAGFDLSSARAKGGIGLVGLDERVRLVGGTVSIETTRDCGTTVRVRLPLPH